MSRFDDNHKITRCGYFKTHVFTMASYPYCVCGAKRISDSK